MYSINSDGSGFQVLHSFTSTGPAPDGANPKFGLTHVGLTLFGTTYLGGFNNGTVFSIKTDGSGFQVLHSFAFTGQDGGPLSSGLTLVGSTLFGTTYYGGGNNGPGTVYSIKTDGSDFQVVHSFAGSDGAQPIGNLTLVGSTLFGTTLYGGTNNVGTIFSILLQTPLVVVIVTPGFNPTPSDPTSYGPFNQLASDLANIPEEGSTLDGRVATYVTHWDSTTSFLSGLASLVGSYVASAASTLEPIQEPSRFSK